MPPLKVGMPALKIMYWILFQALEEPESLPLFVQTLKPDGASETLFGPGPGSWIAFSAPVNQQQTLAAILTQLQELADGLGFDYADDVSRNIAGEPRAFISLSYPHRGGSTTPVIDITEALDFEYDEDGTSQANVTVARAGGAQEESSIEVGDIATGYPKLEQVATLPALALSRKPELILDSTAEAANATNAFPLLSIVLTLPMFGEAHSLFDFDVGQEVGLRIGKGGGDLPPDDPRFPEGFPPEVNTPGHAYYFRITRIDSEVPDEGIPLIKLALTLPIYTGEEGQQPIEPPEQEAG